VGRRKGCVKYIKRNVLVGKAMKESDMGSVQGRGGETENKPAVICIKTINKELRRKLWRPGRKREI
jgi:hypothetical protein